MKRNILHLRLLPGVAALLAAAMPLSALTLIESGHFDLDIEYYAAPNDWHFHVKDEAHHIKYEPHEALIVVGAAAMSTVPAGAQWGFLGAVGSATWILPGAYNPALPYLGISTKEIGPGIFVGDSLTLRLTAVSGPGTFALFDLDEFGSPTLLINSGDGFSLADAVTLNTGLHAHYNWAFSALGNYTLTFETHGDSVSHGATSSGPVAFQFQVIPEPSSFALVSLGLAALAVHRRRIRH